MGLLQVLELPPLPAAKGSDAHGGRLAQASEGCRQAHRQADERIEALKASIKAHYAGSHPDLLKEIDAGLARLDAVLDNVDHRLADALASAGTSDAAARKAELAKARSLLTDYIGYVKSEPLVAHIDQNPFGVKTDLKALLVGALSQAAKAIG